MGTWGQIHSIIIFFFVSWSFGYTLLSLTGAKQEKHFIYRILAELGVGAATFSLLGVVLNLLNIPLHVTVYVLLAAAYPAYAIIREYRKKGKRTRVHWKKELKRKETIISGVLLLIAAVFLAIYLVGAFAYPYLENDDPWEHAVGAKYVSMEMTYDQNGFLERFGAGVAGYLEPYPPTYDVIMGVLHQLNDSLYWTLKFFNALMAMLALLFSFLFIREFFGSDEKALFGAFILATLPSFMSHFIWSQTLALMLFPVAGYAMLKAREDKAWLVPAGVAIGSMMVTQPVVSFWFGIMMILAFAFHLGRDAFSRKLGEDTRRLFLAGVLGAAIGMLYWGEQLVELGVGGILGGKGHELQAGSGWLSGYVMQEYSMSDLVFAPIQSRIDQATGLGWMVALLLAIALVIYLINAKKTFNLKKDWRRPFLLAWLVLFFLVVMSGTIRLPFLFGASRSWPYFAIPLAFIVADATITLLKGIRPKPIMWGAAAIIVVLIVLSGAVPKYKVQTATWAPGVHWSGQQELAGYVQMHKVLPGNQRVFPFCESSKKVIGFDQVDLPWVYDTRAFREDISGKSGEEIVAFLEKHKYQYIIIDATCVGRLGPNGTQDLAAKLSGTGRFAPEIQTQGFLLARKI